MTRKLKILDRWDGVNRRIMETILKIVLEECPDASVRLYKKWTIPAVEVYYRRGSINVHFGVGKLPTGLMISSGGQGFTRKSTACFSSIKRLRDGDFEATHLKSELGIEYVAWDLSCYLKKKVQEQKEHPLRRPNGWYIKRSIPLSPALTMLPA